MGYFLLTVREAAQLGARGVKVAFGRPGCLPIVVAVTDWFESKIIMADIFLANEIGGGLLWDQFGGVPSGFDLGREERSGDIC